MLDDPLDQRCLRGITVNVELADAAEIAAARRARRGNSRPAAQSTALLRQIEPDMQLAQLLGRDLGRRAHHQILGALVHRKEYDFAQVLFERVLAVAGDGKRLAHDVGAVIADGAGGQFDAVTDDVVLDRLDGQDRLAVGEVEREEVLDRHVWHGKWVVGEVYSLLLLIPFVHGEIDDPAEFEAVFGDQAKLFADPAARGARKLGGGRRLVGGKEHAIARTQSGLGSDSLLNVRRDEFGDRTFATFALVYDVSEARCAHVGARPLVELVEPGARLTRRAGRRNGAHDAACLDHVLERIERDARLVELVGYVGDHERVAQIRLVRTVFDHRFGVGDQRKFRRYGLAAGKLLEHAAHHRLDRVEYVLLGDETHFQIELVKFTRRTIGARILVAEAGGDLEVAVEARNHDQLLELLRRLRQRVEFSRMQPQRHEIIARALGRGRGQDRRLELEEALLLHAPPDGIDDRTAHHDVSVQPLAAQIEKT